MIKSYFFFFISRSKPGGSESCRIKNKNSFLILGTMHVPTVLSGPKACAVSCSAMSIIRKRTAEVSAVLTELSSPVQIWTCALRTTALVLRTVNNLLYYTNRWRDEGCRTDNLLNNFTLPRPPAPGTVWPCCCVWCWCCKLLVYKVLAASTTLLSLTFIAFQWPLPYFSYNLINNEHAINITTSYQYYALITNVFV